MAKEQKTYTKEFKEEAVRLLESSGKSAAQLARDLGIAIVPCIMGGSNS